MSIFRLLPFSLVIAAGVATLSAQSISQKNSVADQSVGTLTLHSGDLFASDLQTGLKPNAIDRILLGDHRPQLSQFNVPHTWLHNNSDLRSETDGLCLKMRTYKVARDAPHTDSTHPVGYSTCQPAARFQTHSITYTVPPATP